MDRDGHHGVFVRVLKEYRAELQRDENFNVVRDVIENPVAKLRPDYGVEIVKKPSTGAKTRRVGHPIKDPYTAEVAALFDRVYVLMLRLLQYVFRNSTDWKERLDSMLCGEENGGRC